MPQSRGLSPSSSTFPPGAGRDAQAQSPMSRPDLCSSFSSLHTDPSPGTYFLPRSHLLSSFSQQHLQPLCYRCFHSRNRKSRRAMHNPRLPQKMRKHPQGDCSPAPHRTSEQGDEGRNCSVARRKSCVPQRSFSTELQKPFPEGFPLSLLTTASPALQELRSPGQRRLPGRMRSWAPRVRRRDGEGLPSSPGTHI